MSKSSKKRPCPAVGHDITPAECGEHRNSRQVCPAECPHNPFAPANYLQFLELEEGVDRQCMDRMAESAADRQALEKAVQKARHDPSHHALHAFFEWNLFFAPGPNGLSCAQCWEQSGFPGLKNDARALLRAKMQTRIALLEIHRVQDHERIEAVDLLASSPIRVTLQDRSLARVAMRFACALVWIYPLPHYWRLSGTAIMLPDLAQFEPREIVAEIVAHLGGPPAEAEMRRWLAEHFLRFDEALQATSRMRQMQMFAGLDAKFGKAVYELQAPFAECREELDALPDVEPDSLSGDERKEGFAEARVWLGQPEKAGHHLPEGGRHTMGRVLLGQAHWRIEVMGAAKLARLRGLFEARLGNRVRFTGERLDDLGATIAAKGPKVDASRVPPRLLSNPQQVQLTTSRLPAPPPHLSNEDAQRELFRAMDRAFLDDRIPALDHHTPREAARDLLLRPKLIRLLKQRIRDQDERNFQTGRTDDINWLVRELGADEILFDPPPWRPPPPDEESDEDDSTERDGERDEERPAADPTLPPAPALPVKPLSVDEAARRLDGAMAIFDTAAAAMDELARSGATLLEDADEITIDWLNEHEFSFAVPFLLQAWFALVPPGYRAPAIESDDLERSFVATLQGMTDALKASSPKAFMRFFETSPQPAMMQMLSIQIIESSTKAPQEIRPRTETQPVIMALVMAVVEELDRALRP